MNIKIIDRLKINIENAKMLGRIEGIVSNLELYCDHFETNSIKSYFKNELKRKNESIKTIQIRLMKWN